MILTFGDTAWEFNFTGKPDNELWLKRWRVRLGRRYFTKRKWSLYILIWQRQAQF